MKNETLLVLERELQNSYSCDRNDVYERERLQVMTASDAIVTATSANMKQIYE